MRPKLTIGMATYDDYLGVFPTIQALRMYHKITNSDFTEFIVVHNNPDSDDGKVTKKFVEHQLCGRGKCIEVRDRKSTAVRDVIFDHARGKSTIVMDPHVMIVEGGVQKIVDYLDNPEHHLHLVSGPLLYDSLKSVSTHFVPKMQDFMYGVWDEAKPIFKGEPFEIPMQGLGCFACRTENWPGFNKYFKGFGGEEGYIHEKFRLMGGKAICLPGAEWNHRFDRPNGAPYERIIEDMVWNYFIGWLELYQDPEHEMIKKVYNHFADKIPEGSIDFILNAAVTNRYVWEKT